MHYEINRSSNNDGFTSVFFLNDSMGYTCGVHLAKTSDGGISWDQIYSAGSTYFTSLFFINEQIGYLTDAKGSIYKTINGGVSWNSQGIPGSELNNISFLNKDTGYCVGITQYDATNYEGIVYWSTDGGDSWEKKATSANELHSLQL